MKVTIITAAYNDVATIADTVRSVAEQTHPDIEHLVVDGGSTDGTQAAVEACGSPRVVLVSEPDRGIYDALNKGVSRAAGEVIGFCHADDFLTSPDVVARIVAAFEEGGDRLDAVYGNKRYVDRDRPDVVVRRWRSRQWVPRDLRRGWMPPHQSLYVRRRVYEAIGAFDADWAVSADYDFILRAFTRPGFEARYVDVDVITMRTGGVSNAPRHLLVKWREDLRALRRNHVGGVVALARKSLSKVGQLRGRRG